MNSSCLASLFLDDQLGDMSAYQHHQEGRHHGNHQIGGQMRLENIKGGNQANGCRNKHQRHNLNEKGRGFLHFRQGDDVQMEAAQHQYQTINAGGDGEGQQEV